LASTLYTRLGNEKQIPLNVKVKQATEPKVFEDSIEGLKSSMKEVETLKALGCEICKGEANAVLMECGHGGFCVKCATKIILSKKLCPTCNNTISLILIIETTKPKVFFVKVIGSIDIEGREKPNIIM